jgi:CHAD domain-containing protein
MHAVSQARPRRQRSSRLPFPSDVLKHVQRSFEKHWKRYRKALKRCQKNFSEKTVHDSRVAARRLMATIELLEGFLRPKILKTGRDLIKEHLDIFDDLRDTQVQLVAVKSLQTHFPAARIFCEWLQKREARFRKEACACVKQSKIKPVAKLIAVSEETFAKELKKCSPNAAASLLQRSTDKAYNQTTRLKERIRRDRPKSIHRTRIAFKRFRYMAELLADCLHTDENVLAEMQHYQTMMGDIQDAVVLLQCFDKFVRKKNIRSESATQLREELVRKREWLIKLYMDAAGQLKEFWPLANRVA